MSAILELGPGETFLFDTPGGTTTNNLPEGLKDLGAGVGQGRPIQSIYSLNFGCNGAYILAARTVNGAIIRRNNLPPQLESWLIDPTSRTCKRDIASLSVELGPNNSFYARDKDSYRWHNLPDALEEAIQQRLCPAGWLARPDYVVLGADSAFIYSNDRGGCSHALGNYPKLQEFILGVQRANIGGLTGFALVQWISMSIYRPGHFIALPNSGQPVAELLPQALQALNSMAGTFPVRNLASQQPQQRAVSQPLTHRASPLLMQQPSPPPSIHTALPVRKPVASPVSQPRPQAPHLVSSPIPQVQPSRPVLHELASAPAAPQVQSTTNASRPVSMQASARTAGQRATMNLKAFGKIVKDTTQKIAQGQQQQQQQQQTYNINNNPTYTYNNNNNTSSFANPNANTATYYTAPVDNTPAPTYSFAPTFTVGGSGDSNTPTPDASNTITSDNVIYSPAPAYNVIDDTSNSTIVDGVSVISIPPTDTGTSSTATGNDTTTTYDTSTYDNATYDTSTYDTTTYDTSTYDTTIVDNSTYTEVVDSTVSTTDTSSTDNAAVSSGGDSGGFWSGLLSSTGGGGDSGSGTGGGIWGGDSGF